MVFSSQGRYHEAKAWIRQLYLHAAGHSNYKRFIVLTRSRTGSNMLISCLNSHPAIHAESEIFQRLKGRTNQEILNGIFHKYATGVKAAGFKIFYYHPLDDDRKSIWGILRDMEGLRVIHLKRRNVLRTLVSRKIAGEREVWSSLEEKGDKAIREKQIEFSPAELVQGFTQTRKWESEFDDLFRGHPVLEVIYEDLAISLDDQFQRITQFLHIPFQRPHSEFEKQNPEPLQELIRNYGELKREFENSEWAAYFHEQGNP